ncbi:MAG: hypothetical protein MI806_02225 [Minwuiales bacterium]|nr:hypothetical protein [Minwuiales bacterium]
MASITLTEGNDTYVSNLVPTGSETANSIHALGGDDDITGNGFVDFIFGGAGNDVIDGGGNDDILLGNGGNDTVLGGAGNDTVVGDGLSGETGNDTLYGGAGTDLMFGGAGDDLYVFAFGDGGVDTINDANFASGNPGTGGGTDTLKILDTLGANILFFQDGNNLRVTDTIDVADGSIDEGVIIEDFFLGGNNRIEFVEGSDGFTWDLTGLVA